MIGRKLSQAPAGWYPTDGDQLRYWSGSEWTDHFADSPNSTAANPVTNSAVEVSPYQPVSPYQTNDSLVPQVAQTQAYIPPLHAAPAQGPQIIQQSVVQVTTEKGNGVGTAGFILALLGVVLFWIPFVGWILGVLGLILSFVGVFSEPRGFAIAGLAISFIDVFVLLILLTTIMGVLS